MKLTKKQIMNMILEIAIIVFAILAIAFLAREIALWADKLAMLNELPLITESIKVKMNECTSYIACHSLVITFIVGTVAGLAYVLTPKMVKKTSTTKKTKK